MNTRKTTICRRAMPSWTGPTPRPGLRPQGLRMRRKTDSGTAASTPGALITVSCLTCRSEGIISPKNSRQPVGGVIVKDLAQDRPRQCQTLVTVTHVLDALVGGEEFPVTRIGVAELGERILGLRSRQHDEVRRVEHAVLVFH